MKDKEWDKEIDAKLWASLMDSHRSSPVLYSFIASLFSIFENLFVISKSVFP